MTRGSILGISAFYHDSAAALVVDGKVIAAAQEERFSRIKHDSDYPAQAIEYCLSQAGSGLSDIDQVVFYEKPFLKFERLLETYVAFAPRGLRSFSTAVPLWLKEKLFQKELLRKKLHQCDPRFDWKNRLLFSEHHYSHAASAFFASPFEDAVVLTLDGVGEWATTTVAVGHGSRLQICKEIHFPHSLGLLYSAITYYLGFKVNSGEYKVMGLAPYGKPRFKDLMLERLVDLKPDGTWRMDQSYFDYATGLTMTNKKFSQLFGHPPRHPEKDNLMEFHMDMAASVQAVIQEAILRMTRSLAAEYGIENLCLAGGVALNCVANGMILRDGAFRNIWIQPAAGDAGGALGAALAVWYNQPGRTRSVNGEDAMQGSYLGPTYTQAEIEQRLGAAGAVFTVLDETAMIDATIDALCAGKVVGWFQGRMEFGPRALGNRSIIGDPRRVDMQKTMNLRVKYRESFRPFAPSVLREDVQDWFDLDRDSPYMLMVADVKKTQRRTPTGTVELLSGIDRINIPRSTIPAVTHVDYSARIQTVHRSTNPLYHALLTAFKARTGCPVMINTSFNVRGEPIVCAPEDAYRCFMGTEMELLVCGNTVLYKEAQPPELRNVYMNNFELD